jgi:anaerobic C4-dicarboxylate transporter
MWSHFRHLLGHALDALPSLVSSNWAAVFMALGIFLFSQVLIFLIGGWEKMKRLWKESVAIGVVSVIVGWLGLYACSIVVTVYHDHQNLTGRLGAVVSEKNTLKLGVNERDQYIKRLEQGLAQASTKQTTKAEPKTSTVVSQTAFATQPIIQPVIQPTSELERLNAINGRMTKPDREQFSAALIDYS